MFIKCFAFLQVELVKQPYPSQFRLKQNIQGTFLLQFKNLASCLKELPSLSSWIFLPVKSSCPRSPKIASLFEMIADLDNVKSPISTFYVSKSTPDLPSISPVMESEINRVNVELFWPDIACSTVVEDFL